MSDRVEDSYLKAIDEVRAERDRVQAALDAANDRVDELTPNVTPSVRN